MRTEETEISSKGLRKTLALSLVLQLGLSLGLSVAVGVSPKLHAWVVQYPGVGTACAALIAITALWSRQRDKFYFRGYTSYLLSVLFYPCVVYLLGCHAPVHVSQSSMCLGLALLLLLAFLGWTYVTFSTSAEFLAYRIIPVGLLVTLALYGGLLVSFPEIYVGDLMLWTCISAVFTLYTPLKVQFLTSRDHLHSEDFVFANIRLYADFFPSIYGLLAASDATSSEIDH